MAMTMTTIGSKDLHLPERAGAASHSEPAAASGPDAPESAVAPIAPLAPYVGRQARVAALLVALFGLTVLVWPRGGDSSTAAPGGFLIDPGGRAATLGSHLAPVTLVHFWATWCPPCIEETPMLERLDRDLAGRRDFSLLRVAVADSPSRVASFLGERAAGVLYDPQWDVAHRYGTEQLPETYLVVHGRIVEKFIGEVNWDDPAVRQKITSRLARDDDGKMAGG
jgi:cytochrome c biogenesis protein CcmG, thiol:disulfide interchange protein DsbE